MSMKTITGYVEIITFRNEENGYTVLTMSVGKKRCKSNRSIWIYW